MAQATKAQMDRDYKISRGSSVKQHGSKAGLAALRTAGKILHEYAHTLYTMIYIITAVAAGGILFYDFQPNRQLRNALAAALIAYAAIHFVGFIHKGVQHQMNQRNEEE